MLVSPEFESLIKHLFSRGTSTFLIILGRRETGKTDMALLISETLYYLSMFQHFATNIKIYESPFKWEFIDNLDDLRFWSANTVGRKLYLFDEFGKAMRRRTPMAKLNIDLIDDFQILRKHKLSTIAITVDEKYIDNSALGSDVLDGTFYKPNYSNPKIALYLDNLEYTRKRISGIPPTSIKFDTWDVAPFKRHGPKAKPVFKDREIEMLWDLTHGQTSEGLGLHPQEVARVWRKFVKEVLEREYHTSHSLERVAIGDNVKVMNEPKST